MLIEKNVNVNTCIIQTEIKTSFIEQNQMYEINSNISIFNKRLGDGKIYFGIIHIFMYCCYEWVISVIPVKNHIKHLLCKTMLT